MKNNLIGVLLIMPIVWMFLVAFLVGKDFNDNDLHGAMFTSFLFCLGMLGMLFLTGFI